MRYLLRCALARSPELAMQMDVACGVRSLVSTERAEQKIVSFALAHLLHLVGGGSGLVREEFKDFVDQQMFPKPETRKVKKKEKSWGFDVLDGPLPDGIPDRFVAIDLEKR